MTRMATRNGHRERAWMRRGQLARDALTFAAEVVVGMGLGAVIGAALISLAAYMGAL